MESDIANIKIAILPGGRMPVRQTDGSIGHDAHIRAVVSPRNLDPINMVLRRTLFDFQDTPDGDDEEIVFTKRHIVRSNSGALVYRMNPGESVLVGIGFLTEMPFPLFYWVAPRSGLSSKHGITVTNAPGTVDPDYRGEAGVLVYNRTTKPFDLEHGMRIAQIIFQWAVIPNIQSVACEELGLTSRGSGGFGSTGL